MALPLCSTIYTEYLSDPTIGRPLYYTLKPAVTLKNFHYSDKVKEGKVSTSDLTTKKWLLSPITSLDGISISRCGLENVSSSYYRSSVADKMSDYEDIWCDHHTASSIRSITPAESETQFKAYLAHKLQCDSHSGMGSPPCIINHSINNNNNNILKHNSNNNNNNNANTVSSSISSTSSNASGRSVTSSKISASTSSVSRHDVRSNVDLASSSLSSEASSKNKGIRTFLSEF